MRLNHTFISIALILLLPTSTLLAYAPLVVTNNTSEKIGLQNTSVFSNSGEYPPIITLCPKGGTSAKCKSSVTLQMNDPTPTDGSYFWTYPGSDSAYPNPPAGSPDNYYIAVRSDKFLTGNALCPTIGDKQPNPDCLYCLGSQGSPMNQYGISAVPVGIEQVLVIDKKSYGKSWCHFQKGGSFPPATRAPYTLIHVNKNYLLPGAHGTTIPDKNNPLMNLQPYFNALGASTTDKDGNSEVTVGGVWKDYLVVGQGNSYPGRLYVKKNIDSIDTFKNSGACKPYTPKSEEKSDPYKYVCPVTFTANSGPTVTMSIILNNGIRARNVYELMSYNFGPDRPKNDGKYLNPPYIIEISAQPSDFTTADTKRCKDSNHPNGGVLIWSSISYFELGAYNYLQLDGNGTAESTNVVYDFDATPVAAGIKINNTEVKPNDINAIRLIQKINASPQSVNDSRFYLVPYNRPHSTSPLSPLADICYDPSKTMEKGIYQINIRARGQTSGSFDPGEAAHATIYMNVHEDNPSLSDWRANANKPTAAKTNLFNNDYGKGESPIIGAYTYSNTDASNDMVQFLQTYSDYAEVLSTVNGSRSTPVNTLLAEIMNVQYSRPNSSDNPIAYMDGNTYWPICAGAPSSNATCGGYDPDPTQNINPGWINFDQPTLSTWLPSLTSSVNAKGIEVTNNLAFDNGPKNDFSSYNPTQRQIVADKITNTINVSGAKLNGITLDLEGGFNSSGATDFYKAVSDRLAFQGKYFGIYYFSTMFRPEVIAAFGPVGQALVSGYDISSYRVTPQSKAPNSVNTYGGWEGQEATLTQAYRDSIACSSAVNTPYRNKSWCNINTNAAYAESYRLWNSGFANTTWNCVDYPEFCTPAKVFTTLNGKFQVVMPVSQSSTLWSAIEIFNPDFTQFTAKPNTGQCNVNQAPQGGQPTFCQPEQQGFIIANSVDPSVKPSSANPWQYGGNNACSDIDNNWLKTNNAALQAASPNTDQKTFQQQLAACIFQDKIINLNGIKTSIQSYQPCGKLPTTGETIPYNQCIIISALPGNVSASSGSSSNVASSTQANYINTVINLYRSGSGGKYSGFSNNFVGLSFFALENFQSAANTGAFLCGTEYNTTAPPKPSMFTVQQPWFIGLSTYLPSQSPTDSNGKTCYHGDKPYIPRDPFYDSPTYKSIINNSWDAFFGIMEN
ncbi:MAG: hypothetical protein P1U63_10535 [Coxiellaceae bacterium]|nr:hypothetical protein [Coxiellaceae bacterium]